MAEKNFLVFQFSGSRSVHWYQDVAESAEELAAMVALGEPTNIVVMRKAPYERSRKVSHEKADCEGQFYAIVDLVDYEALCRSADEKRERERVQLLAEIRRIVPESRIFSEDEIPEDLRRYIRVENTGCWSWKGRLSASGYGQIRLQRKNISAHRLVFERMVCPIPAGAILRHSCDVRNCVNPAHLTPGTAKQNSDDMWSRGRSRWQEEYRIAEKWISERFCGILQCSFDDFSENLRLRIRPEKSGCWVWIGNKSQFGKALYSAGGVSFEVRRYLVQKLIGKPPRCVIFSTRCGNQDCIHPSHLSARSTRPDQ